LPSDFVNEGDVKNVFDRRDSCESCKSVDVRRWHRDGRLRAGQQFPWAWTCDGRPSGTIRVRTELDAVILTYRASSPLFREARSIEQRISISWTNCYFGGRRPWFVCSGRTNGRYCGRRVALLYLDGEFFACRSCYRLVYGSQQEDPFIRSLKRSQKIRMRLGGGDPFGPFPEKPRGMWKRPYERHCAALARVECSRNEKWKRGQTAA
jgi:hypothetical protein